MLLSDKIYDMTVSYCYLHNGIPLNDVYRQLFQDDLIHTPIHFGARGQFVVSEKLILSQPRSLYLQIINLLDKSSNPIEGFVIERFHRIIFDKEYKQNKNSQVHNLFVILNDFFGKQNHITESKKI